MLGKPRLIAEERDQGGALAHPVRRGMRRADYRANFTAAGLLADGAGARRGFALRVLIFGRYAGRRLHLFSYDAGRLQAELCWMARQMAGTSSSKQQSIAPAFRAAVHITSSGVWCVQTISMPS